MYVCVCVCVCVLCMCACFCGSSSVCVGWSHSENLCETIMRRLKHCILKIIIDIVFCKRNGVLGWRVLGPDWVHFAQSLAREHCGHHIIDLPLVLAPTVKVLKEVCSIQYTVNICECTFRKWVRRWARWDQPPWWIGWWTTAVASLEAVKD